MSYEYQRSVDGKTWNDCSAVEYETPANTGFRYHRYRHVGAETWWTTTNFGTPEPFAVRREKFLSGMRSLFRDTGIWVGGSPHVCDVGDPMVEIFDEAADCENMQTLVGEYELSDDDVLTFLDARALKDRERRRLAAEKRKAKRAEQKR